MSTKAIFQLVFGDLAMFTPDSRTGEKKEKKRKRETEEIQKERKKKSAFSDNVERPQGNDWSQPYQESTYIEKSVHILDKGIVLAQLGERFDLYSWKYYTF